VTDNPNLQTVNTSHDGIIRLGDFTFVILGNNVFAVTQRRLTDDESYNLVCTFEGKQLCVVNATPDKEVSLTALADSPEFEAVVANVVEKLMTRNSA
jgi:hypothetical protein